MYRESIPSDDVRRCAEAPMSSGPPWAIVLAGGKGRRMRPAIEGWLGEDRPKQFCRLDGERSMLQRTLDRAEKVVPWHQTVTVIADGQRGYLEDSLDRALPGTLLEQPTSRGTGPGVFLPLTHVFARDPHATVVVLPSDHHIDPEGLFTRHLVKACLCVDQSPDRLLLLGARADRPETDYGWIVPRGGAHAARLPGGQEAPLGVERFCEKPSGRRARSLMRNGALWNTGVLVGKASTLWALGWTFLPRTLRAFDTYRMVLSAVADGRVSREHGEIALRHTYAGMQSSDLWKHVVERAPERLLVYPMLDLHWSDWGRPERVQASLARTGRECPLVGVA